MLDETNISIASVGLEREEERARESVRCDRECLLCP